MMWWFSNVFLHSLIHPPLQDGVNLPSLWTDWSLWLFQGIEYCKRCCMTSKDGFKKPAVSTNCSWDTRSGRLQPSSKKYGYKGREKQWDYGLRSLHCLYLSSLDVKHVNEENFEMTPAPTTHLTATTWERLSTPQ